MVPLGSVTAPVPGRIGSVVIEIVGSPLTPDPSTTVI